MTIADATCFLEEASSRALNSHQQAALERLQALEHAAPWGPDIVFKFFDVFSVQEIQLPNFWNRQFIIRLLLGLFNSDVLQEAHCVMDYEERRLQEYVILIGFKHKQYYSQPRFPQSQFPIQAPPTSNPPQRPTNLNPLFHFLAPGLLPKISGHPLISLKPPSFPPNLIITAPAHL